MTKQNSRKEIERELLKKEAEALASEIERPHDFNLEEWIASAIRPSGVSREEWRQWFFDMAYFHRNETELIDLGYGGQFVALYDKKVIAADESSSVVLAEVRSRFGFRAVYYGYCGSGRQEVTLPGALGLGLLK
jgi:hypothetical protein